MQTYGFSREFSPILFNNYACCVLNIVYLLTDRR